MAGNHFGSAARPEAVGSTCIFAVDNGFFKKLATSTDRFPKDQYR
jgi:hypothetical protein